MDVLTSKQLLTSKEKKYFTYYWYLFSYVGKLLNTVWDVFHDDVGLAGLPESHALPSEW